MGKHLGLQRLSLVGTVTALAVLGWMALAVGLVAPAHAQDQAATLVIHVENLSPKGGTLRLGLYDQARYPDDESTPVASADVKVEEGGNVITLANIPPGTYAIQTFQDINSNNKMDTSWVGIPLEPFGFSRDAKPGFSKPRFADVKFDLQAGVNMQIVHMQSFISLIAAK